MALVKWTPRMELETLRHDVERLFERTFPKLWDETATEHVWRPGLDVRETDTAYVVETDLPGMAPENITVEFEGSYVVVKGERHTEVKRIFLEAVENHSPETWEEFRKSREQKSRKAEMKRVARHAVT